MKCPQCTAGDCFYSETQECWVCLFCDWVDGMGNKKGGKQKRGAKKRKMSIREHWRISCMDRDGYACVMCGRANCELNVHHIVDRHESADGGYTLDNGITLCAGQNKNNCHWKAEQLHATGTAFPGYTPDEMRARIVGKSAHCLVEKEDEDE